MVEEELVRRAQKGDAGAFNRLVLAHQHFVYNLALRGVGDPCEAEDVAQEAFLRAWTALPRFRQQAQFRTWLYRIVVNLCYNRLPRLQKEVADLRIDELAEEEIPLIETLPGQHTDRPQEAVEDAERQAFLHEKIEQLPEGYRMLVLLRYNQDLSYDEIAEVMQTPLGTVKTGLHRAHKQLRESLRTFEELA